MIVLAGADVVLPDRVLPGGAVIVDGDRIAAIDARPGGVPAGAEHVDVTGHVIVPGFVDVHVHGVEGHDVLDGPGAVQEIARRLPRYGVTAFCPTSIACAPQPLSALLAAVAAARAEAAPAAARVLPAHLESNFINPEYSGAQPVACLRAPRQRATMPGEFAGDDILRVMSDHRAAVGIVTLAPELEDAMDLVRRLAAAGHVVSLGHSGATYEQARAAIAAGATHATHLFNRMTPMTHRAPGLPGAVLSSPEVIAELICDGFHVHPALMHVAIRAKGSAGVMAITDGTAGAGLPVGARTRLGGRTIVVTPRTAELEDGTLAGSVLTMDGAFRTLVQQLRVPIVEAARMCATTPARQLHLADTGRLEVGACADLVVLDAAHRVAQTYIGGVRWRNSSPAPLV